MKLTKVHIREYKSVWDSNPFEVGKVTCLVGKNEAGKTAILQALYRLNPIVAEDGEFDVQEDYPRMKVEDYQQDIENKRREHAEVVTATFVLDLPEVERVQAAFGAGVIKGNEIVLSKGYHHSKEGKSTRRVTVPTDQTIAVRHLVSDFEVPDPVAAGAAGCTTLAELEKFLAESAAAAEKDTAAAKQAANALADEAEKAKALEAAGRLSESGEARALRVRLAEISKAGGFSLHIWETLLKEALPKFLYFDEYYQMLGRENIETLKKRRAEGKLRPSDHPLLGLLELARLDLDKILSTTKTQELKNKLQGASNHLTGQVLDYWSQNRHLQMQFDARPAMPDDPEGMQSGTNIWGEVFDGRHRVSTGLGTRSKGFVWFFSFLAWYSAIKKRNEPLVLLLDEPGLTLHGRAQEDLLKYFETQIVPDHKHQLIYSTHSPFMVDPLHFDRVRIVQDRGIDAEKPLPREEDGTKVLFDVLEAGPDSLFPLQGALGYEIYQTLFIGPNCLVVEGVSDLLYLQTMSGILQAAGRVGLDADWTITPVGGADKVPTFVALIGAQSKLKVATLVDFQTRDKATLENLYKRRLLKKSHVLTFADFTNRKESDVEDMFDETFYLDLLNAEYAAGLPQKLVPAMLTSQKPRILIRLKEYFMANPLANGVSFSHYNPARLLAEKAATLGPIPRDTLDRFEAAFKAANALLSTGRSH
jgi:predicted ATP-dependent endonuclease of OLD family